MAPPPILEKPIKIYVSSNKLLKFIALKGNNQDIVNALTLLCQYESSFTTGTVNTIRKIRGGLQASAIAALESTLTGATAQTNSVQDFNNLRHNFAIMIAITKSNFYNDTSDLHHRMCVYIFPEGEVKIEDCQGNVLDTVTNSTAYMNAWNNLKVPADIALCGVNPGYMNTAFINDALYHTVFTNDNKNILYNAPGVQNHTRRDEANRNRIDNVDAEAQVKPKSIATYSGTDL